MTRPASRLAPAQPHAQAPVPRGRVRDLTNRIAGTLTERPGTVVLDLAAVDFVGSDDLGAIVVLHKRVRGVGGRLALTNVRPAVFDILAVTRLDTLFAVHRGTPGA